MFEVSTVFYTLPQDMTQMDIHLPIDKSFSYSVLGISNLRLVIGFFPFQNALILTIYKHQLIINQHKRNCA